MLSVGIHLCHLAGDDEYILLPSSQDLIQRCLFVIVNAGNDPVGVGFGVRTLAGHVLAVTADHTLTPLFESRLPRALPTEAPLEVGVKLASKDGDYSREGRMEILVRDSRLDVAVLSASHCE